MQGMTGAASPINNLKTLNRRGTYDSAPSLGNLNTVRSHSSGNRSDKRPEKPTDNLKSNYFLQDNNSYIVGSFDNFDGKHNSNE